jgi:hypothetical protein
MLDTTWFQPHHDGATLYVPDPTPKLGGRHQFRLAVAEDARSGARNITRARDPRWRAIDDDALAFLREAPGETVLIHTARANYTPISIPAAVVGAELVGLADLRADADGKITLPADGSAFGMWRLSDV